MYSINCSLYFVTWNTLVNLINSTVFSCTHNQIKILIFNISHVRISRKHSQCCSYGPLFPSLPSLRLHFSLLSFQDLYSLPFFCDFNITALYIWERPGEPQLRNVVILSVPNMQFFPAVAHLPFHFKQILSWSCSSSSPPHSAQWNAQGKWQRV